MNESEQAIPVGSIEVVNIQKDIQATRSDAEKELEAREYAYSEMARTRGWELLKEEILKKIDTYRGVKNIDPATMSLANIGLRFMVGQSIAEELQHLLDRVAQAELEVSSRVETTKKAKKKK